MFVRLKEFPWKHWFCFIKVLYKEFKFFLCIEKRLELAISKRLVRRLLWWRVVACRRKYFWAWLATCVGDFVTTKFLEIPLQSPFPSFSNPIRNIRCSSSVHGTPNHITKINYNPNRKYMNKSRGQRSFWNGHMLWIFVLFHKTN